MNDIILRYAFELGLEVIIAKNRQDLRRVGIHIPRPTSRTLMNGVYNALTEGYNTIVLYIKPLEGMNV